MPSAAVTSQARQVVGAPTTCLLLEAHQSDLLVLGQQTFFHFATQATPDDTLAAVERKHILAVLEATGWVLGGPQGAAARLGLKRSTLQFRLRKLGLTRPGK